jgi:hypothetical protein
VPHPPAYGSPYALPPARHRSTTGAGARLWALVGDNGAVVVARCIPRAPRVAGYLLTQRPGGHTKACRCADAVICLGSTSRGWKQPCLADFNRKQSKLGLRLESTRLGVRSSL